MPIHLILTYCFLLPVSSIMLGQSNYFMDGTPIYLDQEVNTCLKENYSNYFIDYIDYIGESHTNNKSTKVFNKMRLHVDQCHQKTTLLYIHKI